MKPYATMAAVLVTGCLLATEPDLGGMPIHTVSISGDLRLGARTSVHADTLAVFVTVHNRGSTPGELFLGYCSFAVRAVALNGRVWDNRLPADGSCVDVGIFFPVPPGETRETLAWRFVEAWGTLPPPGFYQVSVYYRDAGSGRLQRLPAGSVTLAAH